jgi:hypothetical protein
MNRHVNAIACRRSLRPPQRSLLVLCTAFRSRPEPGQQTLFYGDAS